MLKDIKIPDRRQKIYDGRIRKLFEKHLRQSLVVKLQAFSYNFIKKDTSAQVFYCNV